MKDLARLGGEEDWLRDGVLDGADKVEILEAQSGVSRRGFGRLTLIVGVAALAVAAAIMIMMLGQLSLLGS